MATGSDLVTLARSRLHEKYVWELPPIPKNDPNWHGPWDCAEFVTWMVFQITGVQYGCTNNSENPAHSEAYSGSWFRDAGNGTLAKSTIEEALSTPGIILIRKPPPKGIKGRGHVAISNGRGGTIEAMGSDFGVAEGEIKGRCWHRYARIPGIEYASSRVYVDIAAIDLSICKLIAAATGVKRFVKDAQRALKMEGFYAGAFDGEVSGDLIASVQEFQNKKGLVPDGYLTPETVLKLGIDFPKRLPLTTGNKRAILVADTKRKPKLKAEVRLKAKAKTKIKAKARTKAK